MEFRDLRIYVPGDPIKHIDRKTSAKKQDIYIKQYDDTKWLDVWILYDTSVIDMHSDITQAKHKLAQQLIYALWYAILHHQDRLGYIYRDTQVHIQKPQSHRYALWNMMTTIDNDAISRWERWKNIICKIFWVHKQKKTDIHILKSIEKIQWSSNLIIYIHTTGDLPKSHLSKLSQQHELLVLDIYSPEELTLWPDRVISFAHQTEVIVTWDIQQKYSDKITQKLQKNASFVRSLWSRYIYMDTSCDPIQELIKWCHS